MRRKLTGERPSDKYFKQVTKLADLIIEKGYPGMTEIDKADILFSVLQKMHRQKNPCWIQ